MPSCSASSSRAWSFAACLAGRLIGAASAPRAGALVAIGLALFAGAPAASAQTVVQGAITADTRWTQAQSPYVVSADISVGNGAVLTIEPGVTVYMAAGTQLSVQQGGLQAVGSAEQPIRVRSDRTRQGQAAAPGDFGPWAFNPGTVNTRLEHVELEHGNGLDILGAAPVLNHVSLRNNLGPAIQIDLLASPTGVGNHADGNGLDGIAVPPGDVVGSVTWALRGIPYIVQSGVVSVGQSPRVTSVTPAIVERGQTITVTVDGTRLGGLSSTTVDRSGLTLTPFAGGTPSRLTFQAKATADAALGAASLRLQLDAGEVLVPNALSVVPPMPAVTAITPTTVFAGSGVTEVTVDGRNFSADAQVLANSASIPTQFVSATQLVASLPAQSSAATLTIQVRVPDPGTPGQYLTSTSSATLAVQMPVPPTLAFEPTPIAMPPDGKPHEITLRLSKADFRAHTINLLVSDPTKASLAPTTITFAPGQVTATLAITPLAQGSVTLTAQSTTLAETKVPLFITTDYRGVNTAFARPVGIVIQAPPSATNVNTTLMQQRVVGVSVGSSLTGVAPRGWHRDSTQVFVVHGKAIPAGAQLALEPADGLTIGALEVAPDGSTLTAAVTASASAAPGSRRVVVRDGNGSLLAFADPAAGVVVLTGGAPKVDSVAPLSVLPNTLFTLEVRGQNLLGGRLEVLPGDGIRIDSQPTIAPDGSLVSARVQIDAGATPGPRVIRVVTPSGASTDEAQHDNTLLIATTLGPAYQASSRIVGVTVGGPPAPVGVPVPLLTPQLGLVVGASVTDVAPRASVIGTTRTVTVHGQGLGAVTSVAFTPSAGLTVGTPSSNAEGTQLTFSLDVAADAALGLRRLTLATATVPMVFADVTDGAFLISAPLAEIDSVTPQFVLPGTALQPVTLRGRNFTNASAIRLEPAAGITVNPHSVSADGTQLDLTISVATGAAPGVRTVIVTTPAGESTGEALPGNTFRVATQTGPTYDAIASRVIGVVVGNGGTGPQSIEAAWQAPLVGVVVQEPPPAPTSEPRYAQTRPVGVLVGAVANTQSPAGWLQGASGEVTVLGSGLAQVTSVAALPADGVLFGTPQVNAEGTQLVVPVSVAPDAPLAWRRLRLLTAGGGELAWMRDADAAFGVGRVPSMDSVTPIVLETGRSLVLEIRGRDLRSVNGANFLPAGGIDVISAPAWSQDGFGELLTLTVRVDASAATGDRVLQLLVPGGATPVTATPANTVKVVKP